MDVTPKQGLGDQTFRNLTLIQLIFESALIGVTAGTTRTQAGATPVVNTEVNRIDTATAPSAGSPLGDGVSMMAAPPPACANPGLSTITPARPAKAALVLPITPRRSGGMARARSMWISRSIMSFSKDKGCTA